MSVKEICHLVVESDERANAIRTASILNEEPPGSWAWATAPLASAARRAKKLETHHPRLELAQFRLEGLFERLIAEGKLSDAADVSYTLALLAGSKPLLDQDEDV